MSRICQESGNSRTLIYSSRLCHLHSNHQYTLKLFNGITTYAQIRSIGVLYPRSGNIPSPYFAARILLLVMIIKSHRRLYSSCDACQLLYCAYPVWEPPIVILGSRANGACFDYINYIISSSTRENHRQYVTQTAAIANPSESFDRHRCDLAASRSPTPASPHSCISS